MPRPLPHMRRGAGMGRAACVHPGTKLDRAVADRSADLPGRDRVALGQTPKGSGTEREFGRGFVGVDEHRRMIYCVDCAARIACKWPGGFGGGVSHGSPPFRPSPARRVVPRRLEHGPARFAPRPAREYARSRFLHAATVPGHGDSGPPSSAAGDQWNVIWFPCSNDRARFGN